MRGPMALITFALESHLAQTRHCLGRDLDQRGGAIEPATRVLDQALAEYEVRALRARLHRFVALADEGR